MQLSLDTRKKIGEKVISGDLSPITVLLGDQFDADLSRVRMSDLGSRLQRGLCNRNGYRHVIETEGVRRPLAEEAPAIRETVEEMIRQVL